MRENKIKTNVKVLNKVDGKYYKITSVTGTGSDVRGTAVEVDNNGQVVDDGSITAINVNNAIAFRLVDDPNIPDVPDGYFVSAEGLLLDSDNKQVTEQGALIVKDIIAAVPGRLLLAVAPREPRDGYIDLMSYTTETDKFNKLIRNSIPEPRLYAENNDNTRIFLMYSRTFTQDRKEDDGTVVTDTIFDSAAAVTYDYKTDRISSSCPFDRPIKGIYSILNTAVNMKKFAFEFDTVVDDNNIVTAIEEGMDITILQDDWDDDWAGLEVVDSIHVSGKPVVITDTPHRHTVIKTDDTIYINRQGYKLNADIMAELAGYNICVDVTVKDHVKRIALVEALSMKVKILVITSTMDRGNVITVE